MDRRFERTLSQILSLAVLIVFLATVINNAVNFWMLSYIWSSVFLVAWGLMLIFNLHVLFQDNSYTLSILVAIITAIAFGLLSIPAILVLARFLPGLPVGLTFNNHYLDQNNQMVLYTSLIVVYFAHLLNSTKLRRNNQEFTDLDDTDSNKASEVIIFDDNDNLDESLEVNNNTNEDNENEVIIFKDVEENEESDEKIVFESDLDEQIEYNTEKVIIVEDLSDEEIEAMKGEDDYE